MLVLPGLFLPLGLLEFELSVIHQLAYGRGGLGRDLHQVQSRLFGLCQSVVGGHNTQLLPRLGNQADLAVPDLVVDLMTHVTDTKAPPKSQ